MTTWICKLAPSMLSRCTATTATSQKVSGQCQKKGECSRLFTSTLKNGITFCLAGMLLRFFVHFYDMEIIEEEAFLAWKEDITQEFPGKGKALFQVNITWYYFSQEPLKLKYRQKNDPGSLSVHTILHYYKL